MLTLVYLVLFWNMCCWASLFSTFQCIHAWVIVGMYDLGPAVVVNGHWRPTMNAQWHSLYAQMANPPLGEEGGKWNLNLSWLSGTSQSVWGEFTDLFMENASTTNQFNSSVVVFLFQHEILGLLSSPSEDVRQYLSRLFNALASLSAGNSLISANQYRLPHFFLSRYVLHGF